VIRDRSDRVDLFVTILLSIAALATSWAVRKYRPRSPRTSRLNETSNAAVATPAPIARSSDGFVPPTECPCR